VGDLPGADLATFEREFTAAGGPCELNNPGWDADRYTELVAVDPDQPRIVFGAGVAGSLGGGNIGSLTLPLPIQHMRRKSLDKLRPPFAIAGRSPCRSYCDEIVTSCFCQGML
jgi:hypothetical protein